MATAAASRPRALSLLESVRNRLADPVDIAALVYFRVTFGVMMVWEMVHDFSRPAIDRFYVSPSFHFTYYGFGWVSPWPGDGMYWHVYALIVLATLITVGLWYRLSAVLFFLGFTYLFLLDQTRYVNHFYFICLLSFLLIFIPAHRSASLDCLRKPALRHSRAPALWLWLLRFQFGLVYFYGGVAKLNRDWLHAKPLDGWLTSRTDFPLIGHLFTEKYMAYWFSYSGLLIDLLIVPLLLWKRTRVLAFVIAVMFNVTNAKLWTIGVFPWLMIAGTLLYFPPDWPRRLLDRIPGLTQTNPPHRAHGTPRPPNRFLLWFFAVYAVVHITVPLRHFLYPGHVHWTEEGHRFAWHMMLRAKNVNVRLFAVDRATQTMSEIRLRQFLTPQQTFIMVTRPDMIVQFAHHVARRLEEDGHRDFEIRAHATGSLNGREPQLFIDPAVDLARQSRTLRHAEWIVPLADPMCLTCDRHLTTRDGTALGR